MPISEEQEAHLRLVVDELVSELRASPKGELENNLCYCFGRIVSEVQKDLE